MVLAINIIIIIWKRIINNTYAINNEGNKIEMLSSHLGIDFI